MAVGVCTVRLYIPGNCSLKGKRQILKSITDRVKKRFNVALAEVDDNDLWQKATIGMAAVSNDSRHVTSLLTNTVNFIQSLTIAEVIDYSIQIV